MMSTYRSIEAEKRVGDESIYAKYNKYKDKDEQKEFFMRKKRNRSKDTLTSSSGKSKDSAAWEIKSRTKKGDEDVTTESTKAYKSQSLNDVFKDFEFVDTAKLGGRPRLRLAHKVGGAKKKKKPVRKTAVKKKKTVRKTVVKKKKPAVKKKTAVKKKKPAVKKKTAVKKKKK